MSPVIKQDFEAADEAGLEFYRVAGEKLVEAKGQIPYGRWSKWLEKNAVEFLINQWNKLRGQSRRGWHWRKDTQTTRFVK